MDIPDTPPGLETDGPNYYKFLIVMRGQLEEGKSLSIAAPASYWYLKAFPIAQMAKELDYIVYMTYDLHGKAIDSTRGGSPFSLRSLLLTALPRNRAMGCGQPVGGRGMSDRKLLEKPWSVLQCRWSIRRLISMHPVNLTETTYALSMSMFPLSTLYCNMCISQLTRFRTVTKAGVPTNKIFVSKSSYGRSFLMSEKGCTGPDCFFEGDRLNSPAAKGKCTDTGGYISNAEIDDILILNHNTELWHDGASNSDILVYDGMLLALWLLPLRSPLIGV
jgi:hypothetical protein